MLKLKISKPGLVINIPGFNSFRTPAEIKITKDNRLLVESELKRNGIYEYQIMEIKDNIVIKKIKNIFKPKKDDNVKKDINEDIINTLKIQQQELFKGQNNSIEEIKNSLKKLEKFLSKDNKQDNNIVIKKKKEIILEEDDINDFIPEINIDNLKISKSGVEKKKKE